MKQTLLIFFLCCWGGVLLKGQSISSVVPNQNPIFSGTTLTLTISGNGTNFAAGSSTYVTASNANSGATIYGQVNQNTLTNTSMEVDFYVPCGVCGSVDLSVTTPVDGTLSYNNAFTVTCAQITGLSPNTGNPGQNLSVGISGTNMNFGQGSSTWAYFYNPTTGDYIYPSGNNGGTTDSTNINFNIPSNSCGGSYDVIVYPNYNSCSVFLPNAFNVNNTNGQITMVNPDTIQPGQTLPIVISGTGVNFLQGSLSVFFRNSSTGATFYPSSYNNIQTNSVNVDVTTSNGICVGSYDVCVRETASSCPICFEDGLYVDGPSVAASITNVVSTPSPVQAGQPLVLTISGTGVNFGQGSNLYFSLVNTSTGNSIGTSYSIPNFGNPNETDAYFGVVPLDCGSYDLNIYGADPCGGTVLTYANAITVNNTLNPRIYSAIPLFNQSVSQLRVRLSGADIDFFQGSSTLSVRLVNPATGAVITGSNINPNTFFNFVATVDFATTANDCGYYDLEISNVPTGCGGTTTILSNRRVGVNLRTCTNNSSYLSNLTVHTGGSGPLAPKANGGTDGQSAIDDLQELNAGNLTADQLSVQVFPNPMDQEANILVQGEGQQVLNFALYDLLGQLVKQTQFEVNETLQVNRENLPAGMYIYRILDTTGNPLHVGKLEMK